MKKYLLGSILIFVGILVVKGQDSALASGSEGSGAGGTVSYSVGQVIYTIATGSTGSLVHGVQQPYVISIPSGDEIQGITLKISAYPNPTTTFLNLMIDDVQQDLEYKVFDINGLLLKNSNVITNVTTIDMGALLSAVYFLVVYSSGEEIKKFKILKN
jgi:hypothetical protein